MNLKNKKVFVAMSGGVDSSVVAALMKDQGYDVVGVTMCFSITHPQTKKPSCCGMDGINDSKRAAQILDIPHYVLDFAQDLDQLVIQNFADEYLSGRTPNPCVRCNQFLKFGTLWEKVKSLGADYLATGHYSKIEYNEGQNRFEMKKAVDSKKDQSYFLYSIPKDFLSFLLFPLGGFTKEEVRALGHQYHLNTADKQESQDICFVPDEGYKKFLRDRLGAEAFIPGDFVNEKGEVVGQHQGIANYTIGQRDKLGIALGVPVYVYKIEKNTNKVYVGPKTCLYSKGLLAQNFNVLSMDDPQEPMEVSVRIRYNTPEVKGVLTCLSQEQIKIEFHEPQLSVTPGQSVVLYDDDVVLGGAVIESAI